MGLTERELFPEIPMPSEWNILTVKHQHEFRVGEHLDRFGLAQMVPAYRTRRQWSDRMKEVRLPLFGGYVFAKLDEPGRASAWKIPGVTGALRFAGSLAQLTPEDVANLERLAADGRGFPWPALAAGEPVRVADGPLCGLTGVLAADAAAGAATVVVNLEMLRRAVAVTVERGWIRRLPSIPAA